MMRRQLLALAALASRASAWTPAAHHVRITPLQAAEETDALAQIQSLEELEADYWSSLDDEKGKFKARRGAAPPS